MLHYAMAVHHSPPAFIVLKGYHVGSKWFAQTFNELPGGAFYFEYEHCLRAIGRNPALAEAIGGKPALAEAINASPASSSSQSRAEIASPHVTMNYLRSACGCADDCLGCRGDNNRTESARTPLSAAAAHTPASSSSCLATGISLGALGPAYLSHVRTVQQHAPRTAIVAHVRTNHLKHALSFLRTTCDGEVNHLRADGRPDSGRRRLLSSTASPSRSRSASGGRRLRVPPPLLLLRAVHAAQETSRVLHAAKELGGARGAAHVLVYERLQADVRAALAALLVDVGVTPAVATAAAHALPVAAPASPSSAAVYTSSAGGGGGALVKAGSESLASSLANFEEVDAYLSAWPLPCLRKMLHAPGPEAFAQGACADEVAELAAGRGGPPGAAEGLVQARAGRPNGWALNESECGYR